MDIHDDDSVMKIVILKRKVALTRSRAIELKGYTVYFDFPRKRS